MSVGLVPTKYKAVKGKGVSPISHLNAFDIALKNAGISEYNLVPVSSIIPVDAQEVENIEAEPGSVLFVVMARADGESGEVISAGIGWALGRGIGGREYGLVAEAYGKKPVSELKLELKKKLDAMCRARNFIKKFEKYEVESMVVPNGNYGSVVCALVLLL